MKMKTYASREAKNHFGSLLDDAQREPVTITRQGRPVAMVISTYDYAKLGGSRVEFMNTINAIRDEAEVNGLTDEILESLLNEQ